MGQGPVCSWTWPTEVRRRSRRIRAPVQDLRADFADDARSFVLWGSGSGADATLVDIAGGGQASIPSTRGPQGSAAFRAIPSGAAQLWFDGMITLYDRGGAMVQWLDFHTSRVRDVAVSPDGTWAATAGEGATAFRWDVDPSTGTWSRPELLAAHDGGVVGIEAAPDGRTLVTVSLDQTVIQWDMRPGGSAVRTTRDTAGALGEACAIVARDFTQREWERYVRNRTYRATCSDLI